jgi:hypothetical protein
MSVEDRDIDDLLRGNVKRQLRDFDWDRLHAGISGQLGRTAGPATFRHRVWLFRIASVVAAVVLLTILLWRPASSDRSPSLLEQIIAGKLDAGPLGPAMSRADHLTADTSPRTVLLMGQTHRVCSDPLLRPHSVWEQEPMPASANAQIEEKWQ